MSTGDPLGNPIVCDMTLPWNAGHMVDRDITLPRFKKAGVDFVSLTVNLREDSLGATVRHIARVKAHIAERPDQLRLVTTADEIIAAKREGRLAVGLHFQGTDPFESSVELVELFAGLGIRHVLLAYNQKNLVGDGCVERTDAGLSRFGVRLIEALNKSAIIVDGSHTGYRTTMEAMEVSARPFIFSHSNAFALVPHYRNIKDDQIRACARTGGLIGVNGVNEFLGDRDAGTEAMFRHVDYIAGLVGPEHVGIGLDYVKDYDAIWQWMQDNPDMWPDNDGAAPIYPAHVQPEQIRELALLMLGAGYSQADVHGILGGNYMRVLRRHERALPVT
ncbi:MAG: dipeptidase [Parvibaculaceae bacterium]